MSKKFYVVWEGRNPGVYDDWEDAKMQVENYPGAKYKGFNSSEEAAEAYRDRAAYEEEREIQALLGKLQNPVKKSLPIEVDPNGWVVDAGCRKNPGPMDYQGVDLATGERLFHVGPLEDGTNNIGEFLAIVHALALMFQRGEWHTLYSDSRNALNWVRNKQARTQLKRTPRNGKIFELLGRAENWLRTHQIQCRLVKWDTERWGEIPADFGRK